MSGVPFIESRILPFQLMKKSERWVLSFKLDTSHAHMGLLFPRFGSRVNKSQLPDESLKDSEPLCELHFQLALFLPNYTKLALFFADLALFLFALAFSFSFQKKKLALF